MRPFMRRYPILSRRPGVPLIGRWSLSALLLPGIWRAMPRGRGNTAGLRWLKIVFRLRPIFYFLNSWRKPIRLSAALVSFSGWCFKANAGRSVWAQYYKGDGGGD